MDLSLFLKDPPQYYFADPEPQFFGLCLDTPYLKMEYTEPLHKKGTLKGYFFVNNQIEKVTHNRSVKCCKVENERYR